MRPRSAILILGLTALSVTRPSWGWGADGHRITGAIARRYLSADAEAAVKRILSGRTLAEVSTWADEIKSNRRYDWAKPLHYANVEPGAKSFDMDRDCPDHGCVVSAIARYTPVPRNESATSAERAEALQ